MRKGRVNIEDALRQAILKDARSRYELARLSGVSQAQLSVFVRGKQTITLSTAAKLAKVLGLRLVEYKER